MESNFKRNFLKIWKTNLDRKGINSAMEPLHIKYIGVEDPSEYNDILKTYVDKFNMNTDTCILFDGEIPFKAEFNIINYVNTELQTMNVLDIKSQDIVLFDDLNINNKFLNALDYIVKLAIQHENFFNNSVRNNFIVKQIVWAYLYLKKLTFKKNNTNKCLYYGDISRHEIYFLLLLMKMEFDVIYINPVRDNNWEVDSDNLFITEKYKQVVPLETLELKIKNAHVLNLEESLTLQYSNDLEEQLFTNTGVFKPWQLRNYNPVSVSLKSTIIDLDTNWNEPARVRQGFKVENNNVYIPNFFQQIDGIYANTNEYCKLVKKCAFGKNTLLIKNNGIDLFNSYDEQNKYYLTFHKLNTGAFNIDGIKQIPLYPLHSYKIETQNLILNKINECILDPKLFTTALDKVTILDFIMVILNMKQDIIKLIDSFDFAEYIPKIVVFLDNETQLSTECLWILAFLQKLSFDIVIFNPSGLFDIRSVINETKIDSIRLEEINYNFHFEDVNTSTKKGIFNKFFK